MSFSKVAFVKGEYMMNGCIHQADRMLIILT